MEDTLISGETIHCGPDHKEYLHSQEEDEQKLHTLWSELLWVRDSATYG